jgi:hypothetical protein
VADLHTGARPVDRSAVFLPRTLSCGTSWRVH